MHGFIDVPVTYRLPTWDVPSNAVGQAIDIAISVLQCTDAVQSLADTHPVSVLEQSTWCTCMSLGVLSGEHHSCHAMYITGQISVLQSIVQASHACQAHKLLISMNSMAVMPSSGCRSPWSWLHRSISRNCTNHCKGDCWHKLTRSSRVANSVEFPQSLLKFHGHRQLLLPCLCARSSAAVEPEPDGSAGVSHNVSEVDSRRPPATCRTQRLSDSCAILETSMLGER